MKGPGMRLDLDVRRQWQCPECGGRRKTGGEVVQWRCRCQEGGVPMTLVETDRPTRSFVNLVARLNDQSEDDADIIEMQPQPSDASTATDEPGT